MTGSPKPGPLSARQAALFVAVITCVAFLNSFWGRFVLDDIHEIERNPSIERLLPPWDAMFVGNKLPARPLPYLTFAIDHAIWGKQPFGYHAVNLLVHLTAALSLFELVRLTLLCPRLRGRWGDRAVPLAMVIAMLWAVHPLQTQAVTYIYQRIESMTGMFCLLSLAAFARAAAAADRVPGGRWPKSWLVASVAAAAGAMASKENAVVLPILILAYDWLFVETPAGTSWPAALRRRWAFYLPLFTTWTLIGAQLAVQGKQYQEFDKEMLTPFRYALTEAGVILHYLRLVVWPVGQCFDYGGWPVATSVRQAAPALLVVGGLVAVTAVGIVRRRPWAAFGVLFFLALAPTSSIMPIEAVANEHRMYLALAGVIGAIVCGGTAAVDWLAARRPGLVPRDPRVAAAVAAAAIMLLVVATQLRNQLYGNVTSFWMDVLRQDDDNARANWALAGVFDANGQPDVALILAEKAVTRRPTAPVFRSLADFHVQAGNLPLALRMLRRGMEVQRAALGPEHEAVLAIASDLAATLRLAGQREEAEKVCREILEPMRRVLGPDDAARLGVELILVEQLSRSGDHGTAVDRARDILRRCRDAQGPTAPVTSNAVTALATCLIGAGRAAEAEQLVRSTLADLSRRPRARPADILALGDQLAKILEDAGRIDEAVVLRRRLADDAARRYGQEHGEARSAATKLALSLAAQATKQGNPAEAARLYGLILDAYTQSLGPDHADTISVRRKLEAARAARP